MRKVGPSLGILVLLAVFACGDDLLPLFDVLGDAGLLPDGFVFPPDGPIVDAAIPDAPSGLPDGEPGPDGANCTSDPRCPDLGQFCTGNDLITCQVGPMGCRVVSALVHCDPPTSCEGTIVPKAPGTAQCSCPAPGAAAGEGCPALGQLSECTGDPTYLECADENGCLVWQDRTCPVGVCLPGSICEPPGIDAGFGPDAGISINDAGVISLEAGIMTKK
jgi:hypothetical protein